MEYFSVIAITPPQPVPDEAAVIAHMIDSGVVNRVHLRHPDASFDTVRAIVNAIPERLQLFVSVHSPHEQATIGTRMGVHFNSHAPRSVDNALNKAGLTDRIDTDDVGLTRSCHSIDQVMDCDGYDYYFLSPFYDSISKPGYKAAVDLDNPMLPVMQLLRTVIPLGGITPDKFGELMDNGFCGAAMLGYMWPMTDDGRVDMAQMDSRLETIRKICTDLDSNS